MKPPNCHFCHAPVTGRKTDDGPADGLVQFADFEPLPDGMVGHPKGLEWFCADHFAAARALSGRPCAEAMNELGLRQSFPRRWWRGSKN